MADAVIKRHDTWPPLRGLAADEAGALDLASADSVKILMKSGSTLIEGTVDVIDPPDSEGFNWSYTWGEDDTGTVGDYAVELEIHWDDGATPPKIETVPNDGTLTLQIQADQDDAPL